MFSCSSDKNSGERVVQGQKTGGGRPETAYGKVSRKQGKEVYFLGRLRQLQPKRQSHPLVSNYGCDSDKPATWNYTSRKIFQKTFHIMDDIFEYYAFGDLTLPSLSEKPDTWRINQDYIDRSRFHNNSPCICPINTFLSSVSHTLIFYHNNSLLRSHSHNRKRKKKKWVTPQTIFDSLTTISNFKDYLHKSWRLLLQNQTIGKSFSIWHQFPSY